MTNDALLEICNRLQSTLAAEKDAACSAFMADLEDRQNKAVSQLLLQLQAVGGAPAAGNGQRADMAVVELSKIAPTVNVSIAPRPTRVETKAAQDVSNKKLQRGSTSTRLNIGKANNMGTGSGFFYDIANDIRFEAAVTALVVISIFLIGLDVQIKGLHTGYLFNFGTISSSPMETMPWMRPALDALDLAIGVAFCVELAIKLLAFRMNFFCSVANCLDGAIVAFWLLDLLSDRMVLAVSPSLIRLVRLARILRLVRLAGQIENLESLFLLIESIKSSVSCCFWSMILVMIIEMGMAIFLNQTLSGYMEDDTVPLSSRLDIFQYFGTFTKSMVTMFELTFGNYIVVCRKLQSISEWYAALIIAYKVLVGFAALRIISGIFMAETLRVANNNDQIMVMQKKRQQGQTREKLSKLFKAADATGDGHVSEEEFMMLWECEVVKTWLAAMEMDVRDPAKFFRELAGNDDTITAEEMMVGVNRLKGAAKSIDMSHSMKDQATLIEEHRSLQRLCSRMDAKLTKLGSPAIASGAANAATAALDAGVPGVFAPKLGRQTGGATRLLHRDGTPLGPCDGCFRATPPPHPP